MLAMQPGNQFKDRIRGTAIQVPCRLIRQQQLRPGDQGPRQSHPLLLPARQLAGTMLGTLPQAYFRQPSRSLALCLLPGTIAQEKWHGHILQCGELRQQVVELPDKADFAITKISCGLFR